MDRPRILFDVMRTLVTEPFLEVMPNFFGMSPADFLAAKHPTSWIEFEEGKISEDQYFDRFFTDGRPIDGPALRVRMKLAYKWIDGMESILAELNAAGYEMHALSNYSGWYEMIDESLEISRYVGWTFVSCRTGFRKPDPQAFLGAATALSVTPAQCLFIDDRSENIHAARQLGMNAILFTGAENLRQELAIRGLLD